MNSTWLAQQETPGQVFWHAKLMLASAMLISRAVCSAQINLRGEFAFGCTPFYAEIMCMITWGQNKDLKKKKRKTGMVFTKWFSCGKHYAGALHTFSHLRTTTIPWGKSVIPILWIGKLCNLSTFTELVNGKAYIWTQSISIWRLCSFHVFTLLYWYPLPHHHSHKPLGIHSSMIPTFTKLPSLQLSYAK